MSKKYITLVIAIEDKEVFDKDLGFVTETINRSDDNAWRVTAMSASDEITRLELLEAAILECDNYDYYQTCRNILDTPISDFNSKTLADFRVRD